LCVRSKISIFFVLIMIMSFLSLSKEGYAEDSKIEKLGIPHYSVAVLGAAYGKDIDGENYIFAVANGNPAKLNVIEPETGKRVRSIPLPGASVGWGVTIDPFGNVYIGGSDKLYCYSYKTDELVNLGRPISSETALWRIASDNKGRIFGGTYPNGKVFMYDPETKQFRDYGTVVTGQQYVRSLDVAYGKIYAGIGTNKAFVYEIDIETGEKREIPLPEAYQNEKMAYDLDVVHKRLFVRLTPSSTLLVYDLRNEEWVDEIPNSKGLDVSKAGPGNAVYLVKDSTLYRYDLKDYSLTPTSLTDLWSARDMGWMNLKMKEEGFKGLSLVSISYNGRYWIFNPKTGKYKFIQAQIEGEPINIQSIALGPDGNIYTSSYIAGGLTKYNTEHGSFEQFIGNGQVENMIATDLYLYIGVYPGASIFRYDPKQSYELDPLKPESALNPKLLFSLKSIGQDRPFAFAKGGGHVYIGTVPDYGKLGGSLTAYNEMTGSYETVTNIVQNQSVVSLSYKDGLIFGGTSVWGGLGIQPTEAEAKLFIWDPSKKEKTFETVPVPGERAVTALAFDNEGYLWGITINSIFKFDPATKTIVASKQLFPFRWDQISHSWRSAALQFGQDGYFYGRTEEGIFRFNPKTWEYEVLVPGAVLFAMDLKGSVYFAKGTELYRYVIE
jgi:streptogramin lyase